MQFRRLKPIAAALIVAFALSGGAEPAVAGNPGNNDGQSEQTSGGMSAEQAASLVQRAYGGRIVSVKPAGNGYNVRVLLAGGRVKTVLVDANGRLSESN